jgi:hypothetical protein
VSSTGVEVMGDIIDARVLPKGKCVMSLPNPHTRFVIFSSIAQKYDRRARYYVAKDGTMTRSKQKATTFYHFSDAKHYAERHKLLLDTYVHIDEEEFTSTELSD